MPKPPSGFTWLESQLLASPTRDAEAGAGFMAKPAAITQIASTETAWTGRRPFEPLTEAPQRGHHRRARGQCEDDVAGYVCQIEWNCSHLQCKVSLQSHVPP